MPRYRLSEHGRRQAAATGRFLAARPLAAIYTSPLLRARQTASILTQYHPKISPRVSRALIEVKTGYEGSPNAIIKPGFSFYEPLRDPDDETMQVIFDRMLGFLRRAARRHAGESVAAVSHADPITIMRVGLLGLPLTVANMHAALYPERSSVTQITLAPGREMEIAYFNIAATVAPAAA